MATVAGISSFIATLRVHLTVPIAMGDPARAAKEQAWTASIAQAIRHYDDDLLARAAEAILNRRTSDRRFPLPGEIRKVCSDLIADDMRPALLARAQDIRTFPTRSAGRIEFVVGQLLSGEMGRRAAREGWIGILYDEAMARNALPHESEASGLRRRAQEFHETLEACHRGMAGPKSREWARLGDNLVKRSRIVAGIVLGERGIEDLQKHLADVEASA